MSASNSAGSAQAPSVQLGPVPSPGPTTNQVRAALQKLLGSLSIHELLRHGGYTLTFAAPSAGRLTISWTLPARARGKKPTLAASVRATLHKAAAAKVRIVLSSSGRRLLRAIKSGKLTGKASFTPLGQKLIAVSKTCPLKR